MTDLEATTQLLRDVRQDLAFQLLRSVGCECENCRRSRRIVARIDEKISPLIPITGSANNVLANAENLSVAREPSIGDSLAGKDLQP